MGFVVVCFIYCNQWAGELFLHYKSGHVVCWMFDPSSVKWFLDGSVRDGGICLVSKHIGVYNLNFAQSSGLLLMHGSNKEWADLLC